MVKGKKVGCNTTLALYASLSVFICRPVSCEVRDTGSHCGFLTFAPSSLSVAFYDRFSLSKPKSVVFLREESFSSVFALI